VDVNFPFAAGRVENDLAALGDKLAIVAMLKTNLFKAPGTSKCAGRQLA
jgi:hypothetical protein